MRPLAEDVGSLWDVRRWNFVFEYSRSSGCGRFADNHAVCIHRTVVLLKLFGEVCTGCGLRGRLWSFWDVQLFCHDHGAQDTI